MHTIGVRIRKDSTHTSASAVRVIVPQTALLHLMDTLLANKLEVFLATQIQPSKMIWEGARPKTQQMDIISGLTLLVEKSMDMESRGAIAQADIKQHYDTMNCVRIFGWLVAKGLPTDLAAACLRHQLVPLVIISISGFTATVTSRCIGGLTGSRLAGQLGRTPVQASLLDLLPALQPLAWSFDGVTVAVASFVHNLYYLSASTGRATKMGDMFEDHLLRHWGQAIKPSSTQVLPVLETDDDVPSSGSWDVVSSMNVLGHAIQNSGSVAIDYRTTEIKMWKAFWANSGKLISMRGGQAYKLALLQRATLPIADQHMVRWPFTISRSRAVDAMQRKMLGTCVHVPAVFGESVNAFCRRRKRLAKELQSQMGCWSLRWARQTHQWFEHLLRDLNFSIPAQLLAVRTPTQLQERRAVWHRPRTRPVPGFTHARWCEKRQDASELYRKSLL